MFVSLLSLVLFTCVHLVLRLLENKVFVGMCASTISIGDLNVPNICG